MDGFANGAGERAKMGILMNLFAPSPSHEDFKRLKGALKRKENRVIQLEAELRKLKNKKS